MGFRDWVSGFGDSDLTLTRSVSRPRAAIAEARKPALRVVKSFWRLGAMPQIELIVACAPVAQRNATHVRVKEGCCR